VITCRRVLSALSALMGRRFRFHSLHVPYADSLNDEAIDSNMDINCTENDPKARTRRTRRRKGSRKRALQGIGRESERGRTEEGEGNVRGSNEWRFDASSSLLPRPLSRPFISIDVLIENAEGSANPTGLDLHEPFTR